LPDYPQEIGEVFFYKADLSALEDYGDSLASVSFDVPAELLLVGDPVVRRYVLYQKLGVDAAAVVGTPYLVEMTAVTKRGSEIPYSWTITPNATTLQSVTYSQEPEAALPYEFNFSVVFADVGDTIASATITVPAGITKIGSQRVGPTSVYQTLQVDVGAATGDYLVTCEATSKAGQIARLRAKIKVVNSL
jgi:hypothetical protein